MRVLLALVLAVALAGCGDGGEAVPGKGAVPAPAYVAGGQYDAEGYTGPAQAVAGVRVDAAVTDLRTKKVCKSKKNGKCKAYSIETKTVTVDDQDWVLVLADGTEVDVDEAAWRAHPVGSLYP